MEGKMAKKMRIREIFPDYPRSTVDFPGWETLPILWAESDLQEIAYKLLARNYDFAEMKERIISKTRRCAQRMAEILSDVKGLSKGVEVIALGMLRGAVLHELEYWRRLDIAKEALKKAVEYVVQAEYGDVIDADNRKHLLQRLLETIDAELETIRKRGGRG
jgi:hypothetical protein